MQATETDYRSGRRNTEVLKQTSICTSSCRGASGNDFASTRGYIDRVPVNKWKNLKRNSLAYWGSKQTSIDNSALENLKMPMWKCVKKAATELASKYY